MRYGLSMKQVCPLYRVQFIYGKVYPLSRTFLSNRQTVTVTFPADNFLFPIGCMK